MRVVIKTRSTAWEVVQHEGMPDDARNALVYVGKTIDAGEVLRCRTTPGAGEERWVAFYRDGLEYIAAEE